MPDKKTIDAFDLDEEFDPLSEEGLEFVDTDEIDDDDPNAIEEMPMMPNMPEGMVKKGVFDATNYDDPRDALRELFSKNPGRRPIYLSIIEMCADSKLASEIVTEVDALQADNYSVYSSMTLCRTLEKAGALTVEIPEGAEDAETEDGLDYLEIKDEVDPIWTATQEGLDVLKEEREGRAIKELFEVDGKYLVIYKRVLEFCNEQPRTKKEIDAIVDFDPLVQEPRRFSNHFIELLEKADALVWKNNKWEITELGKKTLETM